PAHRYPSKPACRWSSPPSTSGTARSSESPAPSAKELSPSAPFTATSPNSPPPSRPTPDRPPLHLSSDGGAGRRRAIDPSRTGVCGDLCGCPPGLRLIGDLVLPMLIHEVCGERTAAAATPIAVATTSAR